ncbi:hypothetical protein PAPYRUS_46 [Mycobacterium phage Papyrus]|uniref:Uncharacterized protein n=1 Tax=Mycobacterium phage Papyrus TaxID=1383056 RepID=S5Z9B2_9CAUD|nr:hypothetical protein N842_gp046 [Mycobacterium phage Papyrus]AGT14056.1 hypothetical protein PAPYRUS_46 [Mycobacterium phage Papyrus]
MSGTKPYSPYGPYERMEAMICAHIHYGPFNYGHKKFDNVKQAMDYFENEVAGVDFGTGTSEQNMDLYESEWDCPCNDHMNFHDYPMERFVVAADGTPVVVAI